jgi:hypothetical protein
MLVLSELFASSLVTGLILLFELHAGIGRTVKEKVCMHTSQDIRGIGRQLVSVWIEVFREEKANNGGLKLLHRIPLIESSKSKSAIASSNKLLRSRCPL